MTTLCPGPVPTEFQARAGIKKFIAPALLVQSSDAVAAKGYAALMRGQRVVVPGFANHAATLAMRLAPRSLLAKIVARRQRGDKFAAAGRRIMQALDATLAAAGDRTRDLGGPLGTKAFTARVIARLRPS